MIMELETSQGAYNGRMSRDAHYIRVSTGLQALLGDSPDVQRARLASFSEATGGKVSGVYVEAGRSAGSTKRPEYRKMLEAARSGQVDRVIVTKLDRICRNLRDLLDLVDDLKAMGVGLVILDMNVDTTTASGALFLRIVAAIAEWERQITSERVTEVAQSRANEGKWNGGRNPYGYQKTWESETVGANGRIKRHGIKLVPHPEEAPIVREIFARALKGEGTVSIAQDLNERKVPGYNGAVWWAMTIDRILKNPAYCGDLVWGKKGKAELTVTKDAHEAIIERSLWEAVQRAPKVRQIKSKRNLFAGVAWCECGYGLSCNTAAGLAYYRCRARSHAGPSACSGSHIREDVLIEAVKRWTHTASVQAEEMVDVRPQVMSLREQDEALTRRLVAMVHLLTSGKVSEDAYAIAVREVEEEQAQVRMRLAALEGVMDASLIRQVDAASFPEMVRLLGLLIGDKGIPTEDRRAALLSVVKRITVGVDKSITIEALPIS